MSKVSPRGPLPQKVYWRRRLLLLAVVVGVVVLVGRLMTGGDGTEPVADQAAAKPAAPPSTTAEPRSETAPSARAGGEQTATERAESAAPRETEDSARAAEEASRSAMLTGPEGPLAPAQGACKASDVVVVPDVEDTDAYGTVPVRLGVSATGGRACTFTFGPDAVALQITSGDDLIWQSLSCPAALEEQSVVVRPGWLTYVTVEWTGRRSSSGCGGANAFAEPGYYWAEAAALGGEPERSQFELETPPKPEPKKKPAKNKPADDKRRDRAAQGDDERESDAGSGNGNERQRDEKRDRDQTQDGDQTQNGDEKPKERQSRQQDSTDDAQ